MNVLLSPVVKRKTPLLVFMGSVILALYGCNDNRGVENSADSFPSAMNAYSRNLIERTNSSISSPTVPEQTTDMPSFVVKYTILKNALETKGDADKNIVSYAINTGITEAWSKAFCTDELKQIMGKYGIAMVTGQLVAPSGENQSMSACMK